MRAFLIALATMLSLRIFVSTVGALLLRKSVARLRSWTALDVGTGGWFVVVGGGAILVGGILLAAVRWSVAVTLLARIMAVKAVHKLDVEGIEGVSFGGEVRGGWRTHAFVIADGVERVAVSGAGSGVVVWLFGGVRWIAMAIEDGLLVWCFVFLVAFRLLLGAVSFVAGVGVRKRVDGDDEYADLKEAFKFRRRERGRSFVLSRDREKMQGT